MGFRTIADFNNIFITADLHLSYISNRSIQLRGFKNPIEHTRVIRDNINSVCKSPSDILIIAGDCGDPDILRVLLNEITPKNIWICIGNHDNKRELINLMKYSKSISRIEENIYIKWRDNKFHISHYPLSEWNGFFHDNGGAFHPHGHTHNKMKSYLRSMDIGLDSHELKPVPLELIVERRAIFPNIDEHGNKIDIPFSL